MRASKLGHPCVRITFSSVTQRKISYTIQVHGGTHSVHLYTYQVYTYDMRDGGRHGDESCHTSWSDTQDGDEE